MNDTLARVTSRKFAGAAAAASWLFAHGYVKLGTIVAGGYVVVEGILDLVKLVKAGGLAAVIEPEQAVDATEASTEDLLRELVERLQAKAAS